MPKLTESNSKRPNSEFFSSYFVYFEEPSVRNAQKKLNV